MDEQQAATLSQFFSLTKEVCLEKMAEVQSEGNTDLKKKLEKMARIKWSVVLEHVVDNLPGMLNTPIPNIVAKAWCGYKELLKYRDQTMYPPDQTFLLPMEKHTVKSDHNPSLDICINGQQIGTIGFTVSVSLLLEGLILKIQDAKIKEVHIGKCSGEGSIMCESLVIIQKKSPDISLPGSWNLGEGVAIMSVDDIGKDKIKK
jgi:hypothetical protein